jgi:hypothetical protein
MSRINRSTKQARDAQLIVGINKDLQGTSSPSSLPLAGKTFTMAALIALVQSRIDLANAVAAARASWIDATAKYKALDAEVTQVVSGLHDYVVNVFGHDSPVLADFGFTPRKKAALTAEAKVARAEKAKATREARGTKGKVQKKAVKGSVQVTVTATPTKVVPVPGTAAAAPAPGTGVSTAPGTGAAHS